MCMPVLGGLCPGVPLEDHQMQVVFIQTPFGASIRSRRR